MKLSKEKSCQHFSSLLGTFFFSSGVQALHFTAKHLISEFSILSNCFKIYGIVQFLLGNGDNSS